MSNDLRVIVVNHYAGWRNWADEVRTRALDLYPLSEKVEFWSADNGKADDGKILIWGHWPRYFGEGLGHAASRELREVELELDNTSKESSLAVVQIFDSVKTARQEFERERQTSLTKLALEDPSLRQSILRLCVVFDTVKSDPTAFKTACDAVAAAGRELRGLLAFDRVIALELEGAQALDFPSQSADWFAGLRLIIDMARDPELWKALRDPLDRSAWRLRIPYDRPDPAAAFRAEVVAYLRPRGEVSHIGQPMQPLDDLEHAVKDYLRDARGVAPDRTKAAEQFATKSPATPERPAAPGIAAVDRWRDEVDRLFLDEGSRLRDGIASQLAMLEEKLAAAQKTVDESLVGVSAVKVGRTGVAHNRLISLSAEVEKLRASFVAEEEATRAELRKGGAADAATQIETFDQAHRSWREMTVNMPGKGALVSLVVVSAAIVLAPILLLVLTLVLKRSGGPTSVWSEIGDIAFLYIGPALLVITLLLLVAFFIERRSTVAWKTEGASLSALADELARRMNDVAALVLVYRARASVIGHLDGLTRRLDSMRHDSASEEFEKMENLLARVTGGRESSDESRRFKSIFDPLLRGQPIRSWVKIILAKGWDEKPSSKAHLDFGNARAHGLTVATSAAWKNDPQTTPLAFPQPTQEAGAEAAS